MIPYITYREMVDAEMGYFILQKDFPHYVVRVVDRPIVNFVQPFPVSEYNLWLVFNATLRGNVIPSYRDIGEEIKSVMQSMSLWFYENRILIEPKKYKKWKI